MKTIQKIMISMLFIASFAISATLQTTGVYTPNKHINVQIKNQATDNQNWIGIYPKGSSNAWSNVIAWQWTNGKSSVDMEGLPKGSYEVRLFYNNSFNLEASSAFDVMDNRSSIHTTASEYEPNETVSITIAGQLSGDKDWAGVYRVGDSNDWANVIAWNWVGNGTTQLTQNQKNMPAGEYEVRLFFHNSYHMESKVTFLVRSNSDNSASIDNVEDSYHENFDYYTLAIDGNIKAPLSIYFDTDNNPNTGYSNGSIRGAERLIILYDLEGEDNQVYKYTGSNNSWSWESIYILHDYNIRKTEVSVEVDFARYLLGLDGDKTNDTIKYRVYIKNEDFSEVLASYPANGSMATIGNSDGNTDGNISVSIGNTIDVNSPNYGVLMHASKEEIIQSALNIVNKQFIVKEDGFDIKFTLKNNTSHTQNLIFNIEIPGVRLSANSDTIDILNTQNYMIPVQRHIAKGEISSINLTADTSEKPLTYPRGYSPVIEINDNNFAVGVSMLTSFNQEHISLVQRVKHNDDGTWSMLFENSNEIANYDDPAGIKRFETKRLPAYAEEKFHLAVRFADIHAEKKDDWITTLAPYKAFFDERFTNRSLPIKDTRPILGMTFSYTNVEQNSLEGHDSEYTQRGYGLSYFRNENSAVQYASKLKNKMNEKGFKRVIFWTVSGQYYGYPYFDSNDSKAQGVPHPDPLDLSQTFNFPPQIFGDLQPNIQTIVNDIRDKFKNSDIDYGFWWGRSGQIPVSTDEGGHILNNSEWNPRYIVDSNILEKQSHLNFAKEQLSAAMAYGAKEMGLDAFTHMNIDAQLPWIKQMKQFSHNQIKFMQEGVMCDYLHTEMSLYLQPKNKWYNKLIQKDFTSPPVLANYLNPNAEVIVWTKHIYMSREYIDRLRGWGFTPLLEIKDGEIKNIPSYHQ